MKTTDLPAVFSTGRKTILRPINKATDIPKIVRWINDPEIRYYVGHYLPATFESERTWLEKLDSDDKNIVFAIEAKSTRGSPGRFIGVMGLHGINWKDRTVMTGALIGDKRYWGNGYGTDAKMQVLNYAFNELNMHKVVSFVYDYNERSFRYLLRCGYKVEGKQRQHVFRQGAYHDNVILGVLKEEWLPIWRKYQRTGRVK